MRDWIASRSAKPLTVVADNMGSGKLAELSDAVEAVIKGKAQSVRHALVAIIAGGHLLIEDVPGIGKTTLANAFACAFDLTFQRIQFTSDLLPSDVTGLSVFDQKTSEFQWKAGPIFANLVLADEINRATPKTQSALLEAMAELQVTAEGVTRRLPEPFVVIATQNPSEHHGTFPLPESQLDRFILRINLGYPSASDEREILLDRVEKDPLDSVSPVMSAQDLLGLRERVRHVRVDDSLVDYLLKIVDATRKHESLELGVSPRGSLALFRAAQANAVIEGRSFCIPDDIKHLVIPCFAHRILVGTRISAGTARIREAERILNSIVDSIEVPV
ncbi:MAG: MoxR-like ATPase [Acidobacteria bacterium OLB17]|nr:MAG: MoxR-like ATPase [Acidobacteria bacterium OLB17]MCZ2391313.1 MoxR family ATPase [Acidobacteriota bacterium]